MHCIFATITPKPKYFESAENAILDVLDSTRAEEGCVQFNVHTNQDKTVLFLYEQWSDESALSFHYAQPYIQDVFLAYEEWLAKPVDINVLNLLG